MNKRDKQALSELQAYKTTDCIMQGLLEVVWSIVEQSKLTSDLEFGLLNCDFSRASWRLKKSHYATDNCKTLLHEKLIIVDEQFLFEIEAAVRSFEISISLDGCPYLRSDEALFGLTDRISDSTYMWLSRMRRMSFQSAEKEEATLDTVAFTYLFFIGHEVGHLLGGHDARSFTQFVHTGASLETRLANAVVKLRHHAEEFKRFGFDLPGFARVLDTGDGIEQSSAELRDQIEDIYVNHAKWYQDEIDADKKGTQIVLEYLNAADSDATANMRMYRIVRGVFAVAMYSWYRDLRAFCRTLGIGWFSGSKELSIAMCGSRENYIHAASLFGDVHQFTLLRAVHLLKAIIEARSNLFSRDDGPARLFGDDSTESVKMLREVFVRYSLLCMMMDTAVKIAYLGAATAWMLEADIKRGTSQIFMLTFETVTAAMDRVKRLTS